MELFVLALSLSNGMVLYLQVLADIQKLLNILNRLVDSGNTVIVIEHNLDVVKCADHIIDLGPEGGDMGGEVIASGSPEEITMVENSYTGEFLKRMVFPQDKSLESSNPLRAMSKGVRINEIHSA